jgi:anti-sigma regulatory factor (Ser/Thr protein kinase)
MGDPALAAPQIFWERAQGWADPGDASLHLPVSPQVAARARHAAIQLAAPADPEAVWRLELLVSELVGNVLRHASGASELVVRLHRAPGTLRVWVCDNGPGGTVHVREAAPLDMEGRGLWLVSRLARRWGTEVLEQGTCVWFELELAQD